jgi:hypothetical protein
MDLNEGEHDGDLGARQCRVKDTSNETSSYYVCEYETILDTDEIVNREPEELECVRYNL